MCEGCERWEASYWLVLLLCNSVVQNSTILQSAWFSYDIVTFNLSPQALLRVVSNCGGREEIMNASISALRHVTSRHPSAEMAQNSVRLQNGIPLIVNLIQQQSRWRMCKPLLGLIRNLALCTANLAPLREQNCVPKLWQMLSKAYQDSNKRGVPNGPAGYIVSGHGYVL